MNVMCDMSQFVVVFSIPDESSATLDSYFMQYVLFKFGLCHLLILNGGISFKGTFIAMCEDLHLNHDVIAKRNHKFLTVKFFYRFLNKSVTIAAEERDTNDIYVLTGVAVGCTWNRLPNDGTYILRIIPAIGRNLHLTLDISLNTLSKVAQNND